MSRFKKTIAILAMSTSLAVPAATIGAPAAVAATAGQDCSNLGGKWGFQKYVSGNIVFKKWYTSSNSVCWTVHDQFGRLSNWTIATHRPQSGTTYAKQFNGFYTVGDVHGLDQLIDIEVWKGDGSWVKVRLN